MSRLKEPERESAVKLITDYLTIMDEVLEFPSLPSKKDKKEEHL
jgi:hypothetical protein